MNHSILKNRGIFSTQEAQLLGFSRASISRLKAEGVISSLCRGLYRHVDANTDPQDEEFAVGCALYGKKSYIGAYSSLFYWNLSDVPPNTIWMMVPYTTRAKKIGGYKSIQTNLNFSTGILTRKHYRIACVERSIIEIMKFHTRFGWSTGINAAREAIKNDMTSLQKIGHMARKLKLQKLLKTNIEAIEII